jgi:hypothetical protein
MAAYQPERRNRTVATGSARVADSCVIGVSLPI